MVALLSDKEVVRTQNHVEMMRRKHLWPLGDILMLKRYNSKHKNLLDMQFAFLHKDQANIVVVIRGPFDTTPVKFIPYGNVDDIVNDGWEVD